MASAVSSPKRSLDRTCTNTPKAEDQPCTVTDDNLSQQQDCYESLHAFKKIRTSTSGLRKSPNKWTKEENQKLAALVASYGEKKWKRISAEMGGQKTGAQCAQHWKRVLSPEIRKGHWDENEEDLLLRLVVQYGSCWKKIAKKIPQRTDIQCRYQYLKAKQSREVLWDVKEDESLVKKVMETASCNFFQHPGGPSSSTTNDNTSSPGTLPRFANSPINPVPLRSNYKTNSPLPASPSSSTHSPPEVPNKENDDSGLSSSGGSGSDVKEEFSRMKMSGETTKDVWNDKSDVNMGDTTDSTSGSWRNNKDGSPLNELCTLCRSPVMTHVNKVVWLEISEHMARLKLTSTLRTALECKTRFTELLGNKISFSASNFSLNNGILHEFKSSPKASGDVLGGRTGMRRNSSGDVGRNGVDVGRNEFGHQLPHPHPHPHPHPLPHPHSLPHPHPHPLGGSGGFDSRSFHNGLGDVNGIKINTNKNTSTPNPTGYSGNNINLTNCNNNNITINITNSYTTSTQNGINFPQLGHSTTTPSSPVPPMKSELPSPVLGPKPAPILSPAPPFPSFSHISLPSFPHLPQPPTFGKPASRSVHSGLESLAAVASILPREMLADYAQY